MCNLHANEPLLTRCLSSPVLGTCWSHAAGTRVTHRQGGHQVTHREGGAPGALPAQLLLTDRSSLQSPHWPWLQHADMNAPAARADWFQQHLSSLPNFLALCWHPGAVRGSWSHEGTAAVVKGRHHQQTMGFLREHN